MKNTGRFRDFVRSFTQFIADVGQEEERVFADGKAFLSELIIHDDWLPEQFANPNPERYQQYLLHCDPMERFSVVSFVWAPGQKTPVHDHTVWGMVGVMRGVEFCEEFSLDPTTGRLNAGNTHQLTSGGIDFVSPRIGDIHRVSNALGDRPSVSIHIYGANIGAGKRHTYEQPEGHKKTFISGYSNALIPNIWDRSAGPVAN